MSKANNSIQIHLSEPSRTLAHNALIESAADANRQAGMLPSEAYRKASIQHEGFTGPDFKGCVKDVDFEAGTIAVRLADGTIYAFPPHAWNRTKAYYTEV